MTVNQLRYACVIWGGNVFGGFLCAVNDDFIAAAFCMMGAVVSHRYAFFRKIKF